MKPPEELFATFISNMKAASFLQRNDVDSALSVMHQDHAPHAESCISVLIVAESYKRNNRIEESIAYAELAMIRIDELDVSLSIKRDVVSAVSRIVRGCGSIAAYDKAAFISRVEEIERELGHNDRDDQTEFGRFLDLFC